MDPLKIEDVENVEASADDFRNEAKEEIVVEEIPSFASALVQFDLEKKD